MPPGDGGGGLKRVAHIGLPLGRAEITLGLRGADAGQPAGLRGDAEGARHPLGDERRLIEAALPLAGAPQRHRDERVAGRRQRPRALLDEQVGEWRRQRTLAVALERVEYPAQRAAVLRGGAGVIERARLGQAGRAPPPRTAPAGAAPAALTGG